MWEYETCFCFTELRKKIYWKLTFILIQYYLKFNTLLNLIWYELYFERFILYFEKEDECGYMLETEDEVVVLLDFYFQNIRLKLK